MIEGNNPEIDVDDLMVRVQGEVSRRRFGPDASLWAAAPPAIDATMFEWHLGIAEKRAEVRQRWSQRLKVFPLDRLGWLQTLALRAFNFLFRDQRHVNFALIAAARELLQMNRELHERVSALTERVHHLESREPGAPPRDG